MPRLTHSWILVFVLLALGAAAGVGWYVLRHGPAPEMPRPVPPVQFTDVTAKTGITFRHVNGATGRKLLPETMGSGVAVLDFDRDGRPDLFFVNSRPWPGQPAPARGARQALYRNRGDGTFEDVSASVGLGVELFGLGVAVGDYDNDGFPDLFITAIDGNRLFRNVGGKRFEDVTRDAGFPVPGWPEGTSDEFLRRQEPLAFPASAAFLDYDGDGKLDLFVCHYLTWSPAIDLGIPAILAGGGRAYVPPQQFAGAQCELYRNTDGKQFENVSLAAGVHVSAPGRDSRPVGKALGVVVCDPDRDGWPDLIVANDTVRNFYFHNVATPGGGRGYEERGSFAGLAYADGRPRGGMGIDAAEIEPGSLGVVIANFSNEPNTLFRLLSTNPVRFADVAPEVGLAGASRFAMKFGAVFLDGDNDGRTDLFTCNGHLEPDIATAQPGQTYAQPAQFFRNTGDPKRLFEEIGDFPAVVGRGCAYLDYNSDGRPDLVITENHGPARLFRNDTQNDNRWLRLQLTGTGPTTNRDAIGAEVTVEVGGVSRRWYVSPARGYLSQSELAVTVGLGTAERAERVTVRWPGATGRVQTWQNLPAGATYTLTQGESETRAVR